MEGAWSLSDSSSVSECESKTESKVDWDGRMGFRIGGGEEGGCAGGGGLGVYVVRTIGMRVRRGRRNKGLACVV